MENGKACMDIVVNCIDQCYCHNCQNDPLACTNPQCLCEQDIHHLLNVDLSTGDGGGQVPVSVWLLSME